MHEEEMSTDDEFENIPLATRIQVRAAECNGTKSKILSKDCKQQNNAQRKAFDKQNMLKNFMDCNTSKSSTCDPALVPETPSPYLPGNKKRQNGDKNEQVAKSKRTCLSDRFSSYEWNHDSKNKKELTKGQFLNCNSGETKNKSESGNHKKRKNCDFVEQGLLPDKKYESFPFSNPEASTSCIPLNVLQNKNSVDAEDSKSAKLENNASSSHGTPKFEFSQMYENLCQPSTSKCGQQFSDCDSYHRPRRHHNFPRGVHYIDSDSEDDSKPRFNSIALKGGRPSATNNSNISFKRSVPRILDSDDSDDNWQSSYRIKPKNVWLSDSDSSDIHVPSRKVVGSFKKLSSSESNDGSVGSSSGVPPSSSPDEGSSTISSTPKAKKASSSYVSFPKITNKSTYSEGGTSACHSVARNTFHRRPRLSRHESSCRRSSSPHPRAVRGRRQTRMSRSSVTPLGTFHNSGMDLVTRYPDLFNADDSSDVEFFTANSYSDTETSTESLNCTDLNSTVVHKQNYRNSQSHNCDSSVVLGGSSEDEISVVFSSNTYSDSGNRRRHHRGTGRRQCIRGSVQRNHSSSQEVVSLSPDPVEQVRQMEEDERYARMLQAQFDAEVHEVESHVPHNVTESDDSSEDIIDPIGDYDSHSNDQYSHMQNSHSVMEPPPFRFSSHSPRGRPGIRTATNLIVYSNGRQRPYRRRLIPLQSDPWMFQFARILGLGPRHHDDEFSDYDALIELAESVGEAVPRGLHKDEINRLPTRKFSLSVTQGASSSTCEVIHKRTELNKECQVCLCDYENGDILRILPCFHEFHTPCIDPWLKINHTCPVCRVEVDLEN